MNTEKRDNVRQGALYTLHNFQFCFVLFWTPKKNGSIIRFLDEETNVNGEKLILCLTRLNSSQIFVSLDPGMKKETRIFVC